jgi:glutamate synthase domain-containing protein 3
MSGGVAYVYDPDGDFVRHRLNREMVDPEPLDADDRAELKEMVDAHHRETGSPLADRLLSDWDRSLARFVKVMPTDYKRALERQKKEEGTDG